MDRDTARQNLYIKASKSFEILKNRGLEIDKSVFTVAYAARMIKNRLAEKEGADV